MLSNLRGQKAAYRLAPSRTTSAPIAYWTASSTKHAEPFPFAPGKTRYIEFEQNSMADWAAAAGTFISTDSYDGYASTWSEFDFGSSIHSGWSGFDVSESLPRQRDWKFRACKSTIA